MIKALSQLQYFIPIRVLKFSIIGSVNTAVAYLCFILLTLIDVHYMLASSIGYMIALINSYILNKNWTFESIKITTSILFFQFAIVNLWSLGINLIALYVLFKVFALNLYLSQIIAITFSMISNYIGCKWIFDHG